MPINHIALSFKIKISFVTIHFYKRPGLKNMNIIRYSLTKVKYFKLIFLNIPWSTKMTTLLSKNKNRGWKYWKSRLIVYKGCLKKNQSVRIFFHKIFIFGPKLIKNGMIHPYIIIKAYNHRLSYLLPSIGNHSLASGRYGRN